jgi:hypothetical protein
MKLIRTRLVIVLGLTLGHCSLAIAQEPTSFANIEVRLPNGQTLKAQVAVERLGPSPSSLMFTSGGFTITVALPKNAAAGSRVQAPVTLQAADQVQQGSLTVEVLEREPTFSGKLSGAFGPLTVSGAFRLPATAGSASPRQSVAMMP